MTVKIVGAWAFPSSSGSTIYETTLDELANLSCNCPGFIFKKAGQARGCKHTRQVSPYVLDVIQGRLTAQEVAQKLGIAGANTPVISPKPTKHVASASSRRTGRLIDFEE